ncbi:MAG: hypothetical protein Kow0098_06140 [Ignavibacteriaceae bacterium]
MSIVEVIQLMLAPGLMISACALLLLGMNNKYSIVVNRIRLLNEERRRIINKTKGEYTTIDNVRLTSISNQLNRLTERVEIIRNAVMSYTIAVALFVLTSLFIGIGFYTGSEGMNIPVTVFFLAGMITVLTGVAFATYETKKGCDIVKFEVISDE